MHNTSGVAECNKLAIRSLTLFASFPAEPCKTIFRDGLLGSTDGGRLRSSNLLASPDCVRMLAEMHRRIASASCDGRFAVLSSRRSQKSSCKWHWMQRWPPPPPPPRPPTPRGENAVAPPPTSADARVPSGSVLDRPSRHSRHSIRFSSPIVPARQTARHGVSCGVCM